jgi:hypothetical protein
VVWEFDGVAVEDGDDGTGEVGTYQRNIWRKDDADAAGAKVGYSSASQFSVLRYPSRWASTTN